MDLAGGLSRCQPDNCEKILAAALASRYFSIQFFASLEKWIGARNPVKIGSSCAAVTGYDFSLGQSPKNFGGEGGKKVRCRTGVISQEPEYLSGPPHSCCRAAVSAARRSPRRTPLQKPRARKLLRKKKNESWAMRPRPY